MILVLNALLVLKLLHIRHGRGSTINLKASHGMAIGSGMRPPLICSTGSATLQEHSDQTATNRVLDDVTVHPPSRQFNETILCFMMTHSGSHRTKVNAVMDTWGRQCDGWLIASNETDIELGSMKMKTPAQYTRLWIKLNETIRYITSNYIDHYDWFYKVDDDTFVIMENLREFLRIKKCEESRPQIFGYLLQDQTWQDQQRYFSLSQANQAFGDYFLSNVRKATTNVEYLAGGSGYVMNRAYLRKLASAMQSNLTLYGEVPEDMAHGATMLAHNVTPLDSRDTLGREYFIPEEPALWAIRHMAHHRHSQSGRLLARQRCCARYTVAFHHISVPLMRDMYDRLYLCKSNTEGY